MAPRKNLRLAAKAVEVFGSQLDLAEAIDMAPSTLNRIVTARRKPTREEAQVIADALGVEVKELFV